MFKTVRTYLGEHQSVWQGVPAIATVKSAFSTVVDGIDAAVERQEQPSTGITQEKQDRRDVLEGLILSLGHTVAAYAEMSGNHAMAAEVDYTPSRLDTMNEERLDDAATRVIDHASAHIADLTAQYNLTSAMVTALTAARDAFKADQPKPQAKISAKAGETASLPEKFRQARTLLRRQLDKLMMAFRATNPEFYAGYLSARVVIDRRGPGKPAQPTPPTP